MIHPVEDRATILAVLRESEGAHDEAELLRELVRVLRELRVERDKLSHRARSRHARSRGTRTGGNDV